jgi:hypothetical protein
MAAELVARGGQQLFGKHSLARRRLIALYVRHRERKILLLKEKQNLARAAALEQRSAQEMRSDRFELDWSSATGASSALTLRSRRGRLRQGKNRLTIWLRGRPFVPTRIL